MEFLRKKFEDLRKCSNFSLVAEGQEVVTEAVLTLTALKNVIKNNQGDIFKKKIFILKKKIQFLKFFFFFLGVEIQCIGYFRLIFALLSLDNLQVIQKGALEVIHSVTKNHECVNDIGASQVLGHLLLLLYSLPDHEIQQLTLDTLYGLSSTTKIVKEAVTKGIRFLFIFFFFSKKI